MPFILKPRPQLVESLARAIAINLTNKWVGIIRGGKETVLHVAAVMHEV